MRDDGLLDLYFRGYYSTIGRYGGVNGRMYPTGNEVSTNEATVMATMGGSPHRQPFRIFATDYETYDVTYDCKELSGGFIYTLFSVSTKEVNASDETMAEVRNMLRKRLPEYNIDEDSDLVWTKQGGDCEYEWKYS